MDLARLKQIVNADLLTEDDLKILLSLHTNTDRIQDMLIERGREDWAAELSYQIGYLTGLVGRLSKGAH